MRIIFLSLLLTGCASNWADHNYGPGDWLNDNTPLTVDTIYNYQHLVEPTIEIHRLASVATVCGTGWAKACAEVKGNHCDIYVGYLASPETIAHEERHCRGWSHYRPISRCLRGWVMTISCGRSRGQNDGCRRTEISLLPL